jgi:hypothetical protein
VALLAQGVDEVRADIAGTAGHQDSHGVSLLKDTPSGRYPKRNRGGEPPVR